MRRRHRAVWLAASWAFWASGACSPPAQKEPEKPRFEGVALSVAAVGDPEMLAPLAARRGEWEGTRGGTVSFREAAVSASEAAQSADVLVFQGTDLGELVDQGALEPLARELTDAPKPERPADGPDEPQEEETRAEVDDDLQFDRVAKPYREDVAHYGPDRLGLPVGGSALVLVYHRSALDRASDASRKEAEAAGVKLAPPKTWDEFDALARFLNGRAWGEDGAKGAGLALSTAPDDPEGLGADLLLSRAAAAGLHHDYYSYVFDSDTMEPLLEKPPFVESLTALASLRDVSPTPGQPLTQEQARQDFLDGKAALLIDRAEQVHAWASRGPEASIGVSALPGSSTVFNPDRGAFEEAPGGNQPSILPKGGGWLVGVSAKASNPAAATDLVLYLAGAETAGRLREDLSRPMLPVRGDLIGRGPAEPKKVAAVERREWSDAVSKTFLADRALPSLRLPGASGYLEDLGKAWASTFGGANPSEALAEAASAWNARTASLGKDRQLWHYRRSLLGLTTTPEPPPRP